MLNPNPDKSFQDYKKQINREAFYKGLKRTIKIRFNNAIEKIFGSVIGLGAVAYIFAVVYIISHFIIKFW